MTVSIRIDTRDIERAARSMSEMARKQIPFATALALTQTAQAVQKELAADLKKEFDQPTPYITRGTFISPAKKNDLKAEVGMIDRPKGTNNASPALYVREQFGGGVRGQKPFEKALTAIGALPAGWTAQPAPGIKSDRYGNPDRKTITEVLGALQRRISVYSGRGKRMSLTGYFVVSPGTTDSRVAHLSPGVYRRIARGGDRALQPVFVFAQSANYRRRIDLPKLAAATVEREFSAQFSAALSRAIGSAR
jgi:hypothetical protein